MPAPSQTFEPLTPSDEEWLRQRRAVVERYLGDDEVSQANYAKPPGKLGLLRALLEAKVFDASKDVRAQCMGIVLGDVFVQQLGWLWRMVKDAFGRDPCVKIPGSSIVLFPMTMISKRIERGETVDIFALFNNAAADSVERAKTAQRLAD